MGAGHRHGPSGRRTSVWRRACWPDGRLISSLDDGIQKWIRVAAVASAIVGIWLFGQSGRPVSVTVPYAQLVVAALVVLAACCLLLANARLRALAEAAPSPGRRQNGSIRRWSGLARAVRPVRWPDGRHVGGGDRISEAAIWLGVALMMAADWVFGRMNIAGIDLGDQWASRLGVVLCLLPVLLLIVSNRRIVALAESAAAEGPEWQA